MSEPLSRRPLLEAGAAAIGVAALTRPAMLPAQGAVQGTVPFSAPPMDEVRIGFVGVGGQGTSHVENLVTMPGVRIVAVCDIDESHAANAARIITAAGWSSPPLPGNGMCRSAWPRCGTGSMPPPRCRRR
jgi:hypothetical protein